VQGYYRRKTKTKLENWLFFGAVIGKSSCGRLFKNHTNTVTFLCRFSAVFFKTETSVLIKIRSLLQTKTKPSFMKLEVSTPPK